MDWRQLLGRAWMGVCPIGTAVLLGSALPLAHDPIGSTSWVRDVEPIVRDRCTPCHSANGPAIPRLVSYDDVRSHGEAVKAAVMARRMPIWAPMRGMGRFAHDQSLSPYQISLVASWVESRTPLGPAPSSASPSVTGLRSATLDPPGRAIEVDLGLSDDRADPIVRTIALPPASRITGWQTERGNSALTYLRVTDSTARVLWTWAADVPGETLPTGTGVISRGSTLTVEMRRRAPAGGGILVPPMERRSRLRVWITDQAVQPLEIVTTRCGVATRVRGVLYGLRPSFPWNKPIEVSVRGRDQRVAVFAPVPYTDARTYWLRYPVNLAGSSALYASGSGCTIDLFVSGSARQSPTR